MLYSSKFQTKKHYNEYPQLQKRSIQNDSFFIIDLQTQCHPSKVIQQFYQQFFFFKKSLLFRILFKTQKNSQLLFVGILLVTTSIYKQVFAYKYLFFIIQITIKKQIIQKTLYFISRSEQMIQQIQEITKQMMIFTQDMIQKWRISVFDPSKFLSELDDVSEDIKSKILQNKAAAQLFQDFMTRLSTNQIIPQNLQAEIDQFEDRMCEILIQRNSKKQMKKQKIFRKNGHSKLNNQIQQINEPAHFIQNHIQRAPQANQKKNLQKKKPYLITQVQQIEASEIVINIKIRQQKINLQYQSQSLTLEKEIKNYVLKYLQASTINVVNKKTVIPILEQVLYSKSENCGNYLFDPFCDCLQFFLKRNEGKQFQRNFRVKGKPKFTFQTISNKQWTKQFDLRPTDPIQSLINMMCKKKQQDQKTKKMVTQVFVTQNGVRLIRDIFSWKQQHFEKQRLQLTWVFELVEIVEQIKDKSSPQLGWMNKPIKPEKQNCIEVSNSHKVLRYVVYKNSGQEGLIKIPKINYKNLSSAIKVIKEEFVNDVLLNQLEDFFFQYADCPKQGQNIFDIVRGMILYGPPGTGKTQLTETLPDLAGFHLISRGLSSADFSKSLVGQTSQMIKDLVNRANLSPHLICSVGIDEFDDLTPDRKDKDQKNKGQGISMLLSVIGGNMDVKNLIYFTSTNYIKKIDQAIRRRLCGIFLVGRPNPVQRMTLLKLDLDFLSAKPEDLQLLQKITTNFTGAAIKRLNAALASQRNKKRMNNLSMDLDRSEIIQKTIQIAKQFSITVGKYTFPEIYQNSINKKYIFTFKFLNKIANQFLLVNRKTQTQFTLSYANEMDKYTQNKNGRYQLEKYLLTFSETISFKKNGIKPGFELFQSWFHQSLRSFSGQTCICDTEDKFKRLLRMNTFDLPTIALVKDQGPGNKGRLLFQSQIYFLCRPNLYVLYYFDNSHAEQYYEKMYWKQEKQTRYSGRIMVDLCKQEPQMAFQLDTQHQAQTKYSYRYFMKSERQNSIPDILRQLTDFFSEREVSYILLLDYQTLTKNAAYEVKKQIQVIEEKMFEAQNYSKAAVIVDLDSLIRLSTSNSDSSMGRSTSYNIENQDLYCLLLHYLKTFNKMNASLVQKPLINSSNRQQMRQEIFQNRLDSQALYIIKQQKWIVFVSKNNELLQLVKKDINMPKSVQQLQKQKHDRQLKQEKQCFRCNKIYTEEQNLKERKCIQHPGPLLNTQLKQIQDILQFKDALIRETLYNNNRRQNTNQQRLYLHTCCLKELNQPGHKQYRHITKSQHQTKYDELYRQRLRKKTQWDNVVLKYR